MTSPAFNTAIDLLSKSKDPVSDILRSSAYWIPLQFVYVEMCRNKDLTRLSELPKERKQEYWKMVCSDWEQWKKITLCQALYVWDFINQPKT